MGFKDVNWATSLDLPFVQKSVLIAICIRTDDKTHETIAGQQTIADMIGANEKTVRRAVGVLESLGILSREHRAGKGGYRTTDLTVVNTAYRSESPVADSFDLTDSQSTDLSDSEPSGLSAQWAVSPDLPDSQSRPTGLSDRAEEINQIYQPDGQPENAHDAGLDHLGHEDNLVAGTDLELISSTEIEAPPPSKTFVDFWIVWPRSEGKRAAEKAWRSAIKRASPDVIWQAAHDFAASEWRPPKQFVKHGATWLNGDCWNDPLPEPPEADQRRQTNTQKNLAYLATLQAREHAETRGLTA